MRLLPHSLCLCTHGSLCIGQLLPADVITQLRSPEVRSFLAGTGQREVVRSLGERFACMPLALDAPAGAAADSARAGVPLISKAESCAAGEPVASASGTPGAASVACPDPPALWDGVPHSLMADTPLALQPQRFVAPQTDRGLEDEAADRVALSSSAGGAASAAREASSESQAVPCLSEHDATCPTAGGAAGMPAPAAAVKTEHLPATAVKTEQSPAAAAKTEQSPAPAAITEQTPAAAVKTEQTPAAAVKTEQTPAAAVKTEQTPAAAAITEQTPAAAVKTEQTPAAAVKTEQTPAAAAITEQTLAAAVKTEQTPAAAVKTEQTPAAAVKCRN